MRRSGYLRKVQVERSSHTIVRSGNVARLVDHTAPLEPHVKEMKRALVSSNRCSTAMVGNDESLIVYMPQTSIEADHLFRTDVRRDELEVDLHSSLRAVSLQSLDTVFTMKGYVGNSWGNSIPDNGPSNMDSYPPSIEGCPSAPGLRLSKMTGVV